MEKVRANQTVAWNDALTSSEVFRLAFLLFQHMHMDLTNIKLNKVPLRTNQCRCKLTPAVLWVYWCTLTTSRDYAVLSTATPHTGGSCTLWVFVWPLLSSLTAQRLAIGPYSLMKRYKRIQFTLCFILIFIYLKLSSLKQKAYMYIKL